MNTLVIVLTFIGVFSSGFFSCALIVMVLMFYGSEREKKKRKERTHDKSN